MGLGNVALQEGTIEPFLGALAAKPRRNKRRGCYDVAESVLLNKSVITIFKFYNVIANESCNVSVKDPIRILIMSTVQRNSEQIDKDVPREIITPSR